MPALLWTIVLGAVGGALFTWLHTPLPWMLGALAFTSIAAIGGARLYLPTDLRRVMMAALGVLLQRLLTATRRPDRTVAVDAAGHDRVRGDRRSEEHTSELQSLMRISYAVFCLKKKTNKHRTTDT